jgi:hypothetical protein
VRKRIKFGSAGHCSHQFLARNISTFILGDHFATVEQEESVPNEEGVVRVVRDKDNGHATFFRLKNVLEHYT